MINSCEGGKLWRNTVSKHSDLTIQLLEESHLTTVCPETIL
uniref:Uncharacterized protein n=1 Tax=Rhizophora mucronata TaxID=61149 RepID=A0A2P2NQK7_RHIMU